jgi:predicted P-loop ATPase
MLVSAVARILDPGCQVDSMIVLMGEQGIGKSQAIRILAGEYYSSLHKSPADKDFYVELAGKSMVEIEELQSFSKAEQTSIKAAISCQIDRYRVPYGMSAADHPRRCIFIGTTNEDTFNPDQTGGRRFIPIRAKFVRLDNLAFNREQLYAEAVSLYKAGIKWWEMPKSALEHQESIQHEDPWSDSLREWAAGRVGKFSPADALLELGIEKKDQHTGTYKRLAGVMKRLGYVSKRASHARFYVKSP